MGHRIDVMHGGDTQGIAMDAMNRFVRQFDVGLEKSRIDCRAVLKPRYVAADKSDAKRGAKETYMAVCERFGSHRGSHMWVELADESFIRMRDLFTQSVAGHDFDWRTAKKKCRDRARLDEELESLPRRLKCRSLE